MYYTGVVITYKYEGSLLHSLDYWLNPFYVKADSSRLTKPLRADITTWGSQYAEGGPPSQALILDAGGEIEIGFDVGSDYTTYLGKLLPMLEKDLTSLGYKLELPPDVRIKQNIQTDIGNTVKAVGGMLDTAGREALATGRAIPYIFGGSILLYLILKKKGVI